MKRNIIICLTTSLMSLNCVPPMHTEAYLQYRNGKYFHSPSFWYLNKITSYLRFMFITYRKYNGKYPQNWNDIIIEYKKYIIPANDMHNYIIAGIKWELKDAEIDGNILTVYDNIAKKKEWFRYTILDEVDGEFQIKIENNVGEYTLCLTNDGSYLYFDNEQSEIDEIKRMGGVLLKKRKLIFFSNEEERDKVLLLLVNCRNELALQILFKFFLDDSEKNDRYGFNLKKRISIFMSEDFEKCNRVLHFKKYDKLFEEKINSLEGADISDFDENELIDYKDLLNNLEKILKTMRSEAE